MSNEFVMVPREPTDEMKEAARNAPVPAVMIDSISGQRDLWFAAQYKSAIAVAPKPAEQHQGEPVAWRYRHAKPGMSWFFTESPDARGCLVDGFEYEVSPLYVRADPGEVERLREGIAKHWKVVCDQRAEIESLRDQLTKVVRSGALTAPEHEALEAECCALSATAEPSAPVCENCGASTGQACNGKGCGYLEAGNGAPVEHLCRGDKALGTACGKCKRCVDAPVERDGWISVAERKPERNKLVLVAFDTHIGKNYTTAKLCQDGRAHFDCETWYVQVSGGQQLRTVTHWREFDCSVLDIDSPTPDEIIELCHKYWREQRKGGEPGAVKWIQDPETGALMIFTRGEYREQLMDLVYSFGRFQVPGVEKP